MNKIEYINHLEKISNDAQYQLSAIQNDNYKNRLSYLRSKVYSIVLSSDLRERYDDEIFFKEVLLARDIAEYDFLCEFTNQSNANIINTIDKTTKDFLSNNQCIISTFHIGSYFMTAVLSGHFRDLCIIMDETTYNSKYQNFIELRSKFIDSKIKIEYINIESRRGLSQMIKYIKEGFSIFFYSDGNTGISGNSDIHNNLRINFFKSSLYVKKGIADFSYKYNLPIIQLYLLKDKKFQNYIKYEDVIYPDHNIQKTEYVEETTKLIWKHFTSILVESPTAWEGWLYLFRFYPEYNHIGKQKEKMDVKIYFIDDKTYFYIKDNKYYAYNILTNKNILMSEILYKFCKKLKDENIFLEEKHFYKLIKDKNIRNILIENQIFVVQN